MHTTSAGINPLETCLCNGTQNKIEELIPYFESRCGSFFFERERGEDLDLRIEFYFAKRTVLHGPGKFFGTNGPVKGPIFISIVPCWAGLGRSISFPYWATNFLVVIVQAGKVCSLLLPEFLICCH
jgi:hypothetical protein